jgi:hypothetical protein
LWEGDQRCGRGRMTYADGAEYDGCWKRSMRDGHGRWIMANGDCYDGLFSHDLPYGMGVCRYHDGSEVCQAQPL